MIHYIDHEQILDDYQRDDVVRIREFIPLELVTEIRAELEHYIRDDLDSKPSDARILEADEKTIRNLWRLEQQFCATLQPGDATIHHCETIHYSAPNQSEHLRFVILVVYRGTHTQTDPELQAAYASAVSQTPPV